MEIGGLIDAGFRARRAFRNWNQRRKARKSGKEFAMELDLGTRTSTNTVVGTSLLGSVYVQLIGLLPWPNVAAALSTPEMVILVGSAIAWVIARISKTPAVPGKI